MTEGRELFERALGRLREYGLLLLSDAVLPSVAGLVVGAPVRGSWWGHPRGHAIFEIANRLAEHPEALLVRLVSGKVTYVHLKLWPALLSTAMARDAWQMDGLSAAASSTLAEITAQGTLRTDARASATRVSSRTVHELELRLLVHSQEVHTERGSHAKMLESWEHWMDRAGFAEPRVPSATARSQLEEAAAGLSSGSGSRAWLPWQRNARSPSGRTITSRS